MTLSIRLRSPASAVELDTAVEIEAPPSARESRPSTRLRAAPIANARRLDRRAVYLGEGLTLRLLAGDAVLRAEVIDLTPAGLGLVVLEGTALPAVGDAVALEHTGRATASLRQRAVVRSVGTLRIGNRELPRIGLSIAAPRTPAGSTAERRRGDRHACPEGLPALASAMCPLFFHEWLHFGVTQIGAGGMTLRTSLRNKALLPGLELAFTLTLPISGALQVRGRLTSVRREGSSREFVVGVAWVDPSRALRSAISEYLLLGDKKLTPARLREGGLEVVNVGRAVTYGYASRPHDYEELLKLRLLAHQADGRLGGATTAALASPYDAHSRHLTCRFGGRIVGYVRVIYVDGDPARSQYATEGGHEIPSWLWEAGFVEAGAGATDPEFQRAGLFVPLMQHAVRVAMQSGYRYLLGACSEELLEMYQHMGFRLLETRVVEPKPGWRFTSHLICLDAHELVTDPPQGKTVEAMAAAVSFVGLPPSETR